MLADGSGHRATFGLFQLVDATLERIQSTLQRIDVAPYRQLELLEHTLDVPARTVEGRLWGGNLAMLVSLLGTPFLPRVRDGILFVEDVNEPAYKLERMFLQLAHAGVLQRQSAIVLGEGRTASANPRSRSCLSASAAVNRV